MEKNQHLRRVWDPFVRFHHWALVASFALAWVSAEESMLLHEQAGYFMLVLITLRLAWGVIGTQHARFTDFIYSPAKTFAYLSSLKSGTPRHYVGHNPAGGWMIILLLVMLLATIGSGIMMEGLHESAWEEIHEAFANLTILLVLVHVTGVVVAGLQHGENLVKAMITGYKQRGDNHE
jgi:cytochrome b